MGILGGGHTAPLLTTTTGDVLGVFEVVVLLMLALLTYKTLAPSLKIRKRRPLSPSANVREVESSGIGLASVDEQDSLQTGSKSKIHNSTVLILPTRGMIDVRVWRRHDALMWPMNQRRIKLDVVGKEVAEAYNELVRTALTHPVCGDWPWILTYEEDNGPEPDAFLKLLEAIRHCPDCREPIGNERYCSQGHRAYDAVGGLYFTKTRPSFPMAFGHPDVPNDFSTRSVGDHVPREDPETGQMSVLAPLDQVMEVNAVAMGFTLFRAELFREMDAPWFATLDPEQALDGSTMTSYTQDLYFCQRAKEEVGARFAVHCGCRVAHYDTTTGRTY